MPYSLFIEMIRRNRGGKGGEKISGPDATSMPTYTAVRRFSRGNMGGESTDVFTMGSDYTLSAGSTVFDSEYIVKWFHTESVI